MTAASPRSFHSMHSYSRSEGDTGRDQKSWSNVLPQSFCAQGAVQTPREMAGGAAHARARKLAGGVGDGIGGAAFRDWFAPAFARWLQLNFSSHELVATTFGVRGQTALNWWNAANRASGDTVALVFLTFPHAAAWFLAEWEGGK